MDRVERAADQVPVMARDVTELKNDIGDVLEDVRSLRRALYTTALSVVGGSVLMVISVLEVFNK